MNSAPANQEISASIDGVPFHPAHLFKIAHEVIEEVQRAHTKFPTWPTDPLHAVAVLNEESGELNKELLQLCYEPHKTTPETARKEAVQTAAMALRFLASFDRYVFERGSLHFQPLA